VWLDAACTIYSATKIGVQSEQAFNAVSEQSSNVIVIVFDTVLELSPDMEASRCQYSPMPHWLHSWRLLSNVVLAILPRRPWDFNDYGFVKYVTLTTSEELRFLDDY
jgi:hypothetical protein